MFADLLLLGNNVLNFSSGFIVCVHCMKPSVFVKSVHIILFVIWMIALSLIHIIMNGGGCIHIVLYVLVATSGLVGRNVFIYLEGKSTTIDKV